MKIALPKLYRGKKRLAKRYLGKRDSELLRWALTIKPGDYIGTCEGSNRQVTSVEVQWSNEGVWSRGKPNRTYFLDQIRFTDTNQRWHHCPGGLCAFPAIKPEEVHRWWTTALEDRIKNQEEFEKLYQPEAYPEVISRVLELDKAVKEGCSLVDSFGEILPQFQEVVNLL